eukprot:m.234495 g.234495  ORF g.234495 m.234495 type:complete len:615 (-) comp19323_c0_seq1:221-2065(-)
MQCLHLKFSVCSRRTGLMARLSGGHGVIRSALCLRTVCTPSESGSSAAGIAVDQGTRWTKNSGQAHRTDGVRRQLFHSTTSWPCRPTCNPSDAAAHEQPSSDKILYADIEDSSQPSAQKNWKVMRPSSEDNDRFKAKAVFGPRKLSVLWDLDAALPSHIKDIERVSNMIWDMSRLLGFERGDKTVSAHVFATVQAWHDVDDGSERDNGSRCHIDDEDPTWDADERLSGWDAKARCWRCGWCGCKFKTADDVARHTQKLHMREIEKQLSHYVGVKSGKRRRHEALKEKKYALVRSGQKLGTDTSHIRHRIKDKFIECGYKIERNALATTKTTHKKSTTKKARQKHKRQRTVSQERSPIYGSGIQTRTDKLIAAGMPKGSTVVLVSTGNAAVIAVLKRARSLGLHTVLVVTKVFTPKSLTATAAALADVCIECVDTAGADVTMKSSAVTDWFATVFAQAAARQWDMTVMRQHTGRQGSNAEYKIMVDNDCERWKHEAYNAGYSANDVDDNCARVAVDGNGNDDINLNESGAPEDVLSTINTTTYVVSVMRDDRPDEYTNSAITRKLNFRQPSKEDNDLDAMYIIEHSRLTGNKSKMYIGDILQSEVSPTSFDQREK